MMNKYRYYASMERGPEARPPVCLRYAMWATAASFSQSYRSVEDLLYKRARQYIEATEMKNQGEHYLTLYHAQTWCLIATYEVTKAYFTRSWMSVGRAICLVQKLGLSNLDVEDTRLKHLSLPAHDWIELEEGRRTFWAAFYADRWASTMTGWPMILDETKINTNMPASEECFERGIPHESVSLAAARSPEGGRNLSPFGGLLLSTALYGFNHQHVYQAGVDDRPEDVENGKFWKRHRILDNAITNTFMFLPEHLRLPDAGHNMTSVFTHISLHTLVILLHQIAIGQAVTNNLDAGVVEQSQARILMAAEEIVSILRLVSNQEAVEMASWAGFCLFVAAKVFLKDHNSAPLHYSPSANIQFLISIMKTIGLQYPITDYFVAQLELEVQTAGIDLNTPIERCDDVLDTDTSTRVTFNGSMYFTNEDQ
ncbi:fungal-specific transcription factor domain-containing protein [Leptodontidium sp. 2 PMI_412]|nr:fungal-specific transcription factor domain-containing protein [Leptodontidium sp. 2 PMI_412]